MQKASRHGYLDAPAPKENPLPVPVPPGATVVEPRVPDPKENPVAMAALGAKPSARAERPRMLQSPHCRGGMCHIICTQRRPGGKFNPKQRHGEVGGGRTTSERMRDTARAPNAQEARPPRRGPWDRRGGGPSVRRGG